MNRFRTKKKTAKEGIEAAGRASNNADTPPTLKSSRTFKKGKKNAPVEPKVEIDLSTALPPSDDFRTSLLMSGLSARFSMLREQDDPNSLLGKASDDSVLFPKRQSKLDHLNSFMPNGLSDIAEVSSIRSSNQNFRQPFADFGRKGSLPSLESTGMDEGGSIMSRAKPGEGNNLFGGRQKVYRIPLKAPESNGDGKDSPMRGRARYDDDMSQSAFQRFKERERQQAEYDEQQDRVEESTSPVRSSSPPLSGYNRNRETSSTTSSGPTNTRTSTAAISINSQSTSISSSSNGPSGNGSTAVSGADRSAAPTPGVERHTTKTRRLYETGLEKNLHEQQHTAMSRIDSLTRQQNLTPQTPPLMLRSAGSVSSLADRYERRQLSSKPSEASLRAVSPPPSATALGSFEFGIKPASSATSPTSFHNAPLSPPMSDGDDNTPASNLPIDARDVGKATALGTFMKPAQPYDDTKYSERQIQMNATNGRDLVPKSRPLQASPPAASRNRAESNATVGSSRSGSASSAYRQPFVPRNRIPEMRSAESNRRLPLQSPPTARRNQASSPFMNVGIGNQGFDAMPTDSQIPEDKPVETQPTAPLSSRHIGLPKLNVPDAAVESSNEQDAPNPTVTISQTDVGIRNQDEPVDSPTLGPAGLSGMVRQHMRSDSNASSFFGPPSPGLVNRYLQDPTIPWDDDKLDEKVHGETHLAPVPMPFKSPSPSDESVFLFDPDSPNSPKASPLAIRSPNVETSHSERVDKPAPEQEALEQHRRESSSHSIKFANELAERRRRVQENLKSFVESDVRSVSPVPKKLNRESNAGNTKTRKLLGIGNATISSSTSPNRGVFNDGMSEEEREDEIRQGLRPSMPVQPKLTHPALRDERHAPEKKWMRDTEGERFEPGNHHANYRRREFREESQSRAGHRFRYENGERDGGQPMHRKTSQQSKDSTSSSGHSRPSTRDRSSSSASGRSKSRTGTYRDDLARAMAEGIGTSAQAMYVGTPSSQSAAQAATPNGHDNRMRSDSYSRPAPPVPGSYFPKQSLHPIQTGDQAFVGTSPRTSPTTPFSAASTPALTPMSSRANTPTAQAHGLHSGGRIPPRKKVVNKFDISEPTLLSSTSRIDTVNLPPGASLKNGAEIAPPVPPINPRRRQTKILGVFSSSKSSEIVPTAPPFLSQQASPVEDRSVFSGDERDGHKPRKLRKSSSEGGNLGARARQLASAHPSPSMPANDQRGGMF